jgi:hypothetical protein
MEEKRKRGKPKTGRTTKHFRAPLDFDVKIAMELYYDVLPTLTHWHDRIDGKETSPRFDALIKLYKELNMSPEMLERGR